jgi:hypothetical protein
MVYTINGVSFEIPDAWLEEAGMSQFESTNHAFNHIDQGPDVIIEVVPISEVAPPSRAAGVEGLRKDRTVSILRGLRTKNSLPAVEVVEDSSRRYRFTVYHGFHRYYASAAAGFSHLPVTVTGPSW